MVARKNKKIKDFLVEVSLYVVDTVEEAVVQFENWRRDGDPICRGLVICAIGFLVGLVFLSGCSTATPPSVVEPQRVISLDEFACVVEQQVQSMVLHCGSYESWERYEKEMMKKFGT